jgi:hypothetical protein
MARDASLVPMITACSAVEAEEDIYIWFVRLFKPCVTRSQVKCNLSFVFYLMLPTFLDFRRQDHRVFASFTINHVQNYKAKWEACMLYIQNGFPL